MNVLKALSTAVIVGSLMGSAAFAAPKSGGSEMGVRAGRTMKTAPIHKAKKKTNRKTAHSKKFEKQNLNRLGANKRLASRN